MQTSRSVWHEPIAVSRRAGEGGPEFHKQPKCCSDLGWTGVLELQRSPGRVVEKRLMPRRKETPVRCWGTSMNTPFAFVSFPTNTNLQGPTKGLGTA